MRKTVWLVLMAILTVSVIVAGCSGAASSTPPQTTGTTPSATPVQTSVPTKTTSPVASPTAKAPRDGGTLRYITTEAPTGSIGIPESMLGMAGMHIPPVIEALIRMDARGTVTPLLAESYEWSNNNLTLTLKLRKNVKFHDGTDFNADVCIWNFDQRMAAKVQGTDNIASYKKIDDFTVQIDIKKFTNTWFSNLRGTLGMMISKAWVEQKGKAYVDWHPVGAGPFIFKEYVDKDHMTLVRNPNYWGKKPYLDAIQYVYIADATTAQLAFENGEGDVLGVMSAGGKVANQLKAKGFAVTARPGGLSIALVPSVTNPNSPLAKKAVREAIEYAIDKEAIAKNVGQGYYNAWYQWVGGSQPAFDPNFQGRRYDPVKAKLLLGQAGYPEGFKTKLICGTHLAGDELPAIQAYLKEIGIQADIDLVSVAKWIELETNGWPEGILESPHAMTELYGIDVERYAMRPAQPNWGKGIYWDSAYRPDELEKACQEYMALPFGDAEVAKAKEIVKIIYDNVTFIPLWDSMAISIIQPYVKDMRKDLPYASGPVGWDWWNTWLDK